MKRSVDPVQKAFGVSLFNVQLIAIYGSTRKPFLQGAFASHKFTDTRDGLGRIETFAYSCHSSNQSRLETASRANDLILSSSRPRPSPRGSRIVILPRRASAHFQIPSIAASIWPKRLRAWLNLSERSTEPCSASDCSF